MGTTPVFGWPYPDASDLVRDAPQAFEDLADAIEGTVDGGIIQVVTASTSTTVTNATNNFVDSGLTATITPRGTASKVLVIVDQGLAILSGSPAAGYVSTQLLRGTAVIHTPVQSSTGPFEHGSANATTDFYVRGSLVKVDSPATSSAVTYKTQFRRYNAGTAEAQPTGATNNGTSYITLLEVGS